MSVSVKSHLIDLHEEGQRHNTEMAEHHTAAAQHLLKFVKSFAKTAKEEPEAHEHLSALAKKHEDMAEAHTQHASHHAAAVEACQKAESPTDLTKLVSRVTPNAPKMVPRAGQRGHAQADMPLEFQKLFATDDDTLMT